MKLKELIEERDVLIKELDEISRSGQNEQKIKDYLSSLNSDMDEMLETVPTISVKEFNDMIKQIFKTKYNIDAEFKILNHAFTDKDEERRLDFVLSLKRENSSDADNFKLASQSVRRNFIASSSKFLVKLNKFLLRTIGVLDKSREWRELTNKYPEFKDVLLEVISQIKINELSKNKSLIASMIEKKKKELLSIDNSENENSTITKTDIQLEIEENKQELGALETVIDSWKL